MRPQGGVVSNRKVEIQSREYPTNPEGRQYGCLRGHSSRSANGTPANQHQAHQSQRQRPGLRHGGVQRTDVQRVGIDATGTEGGIRIQARATPRRWDGPRPVVSEKIPRIIRAHGPPTANPTSVRPRWGHACRAPRKACDKIPAFFETTPRSKGSIVRVLAVCRKLVVAFLLRFGFNEPAGVLGSTRSRRARTACW